MNPLRVLKNGQRVDPFGYISTSLQKKLRKNVGTQEFLVFPTQGNQYHWDKKYVVACFHHISIISKALLLEFFLFIDGGEEEKVCKERRVGDGGGGQVLVLVPSHIFEPKSRKKTSKMDFVKMLLGLAASHLGGLVLCALYAGGYFYPTG